MRAFKLYSVSNFLVYNTVLLTVDIMLYIPSLDLLVIWILHLLTLFAHLHTPLPNLASDRWLSNIGMYGFNFLKKDSTCKWNHTVFEFICLTYFTWCNSLKFHPCCGKWQYLLNFYDWLLFCCICVSRFLLSIHLSAVTGAVPLSWLSLMML